MRGMFLHKFAARGLDQAATLKRAFESGNVLELAQQAQAIKDLAAELSDDALYARAEELARSAERGDLPGTSLALEGTREEIARSVETAIEQLSQLTAEAAGVTPSRS
jgi:hypothetical protein